MSSKKKRRHQEFLKRKAKLDYQKKQQERERVILKDGNIEEMASLMGIRLS